MGFNPKDVGVSGCSSASIIRALSSSIRTRPPLLALTKSPHSRTLYICIYIPQSYPLTPNGWSVFSYVAGKFLTRVFNHPWTYFCYEIYTNVDFSAQRKYYSILWKWSEQNRSNICFAILVKFPTARHQQHCVPLLWLTHLCMAANAYTKLREQKRKISSVYFRYSLWVIRIHT
jgi:hypothetical protein